MKFLRVFGLFLFMFQELVFASKALYSITPVGAAVVNLPPHFFARANYRVENQTEHTETLMYQSMPGVTQSQNPGYCSSPFTLAPKQSCILSLRINGDIITSSGLIGGPMVCKLNSSAFCSVPARANQLTINLTPLSVIVLANSGSGSGGFLSFCAIGSEGALNHCQNFSDLSFGALSGVAKTGTQEILTANNLNGFDSIAVCTPQAILTTNNSCQSSTAAGLLNSPRTAYVNNNYFYTMNYGNSTVLQCNLTLQTCATTGNGFSGPLGSMTIYNHYAYIPNSSNNTISICTVSSVDGTFSACTTFTNSSFSSPSGITVADGYAYIVSVWSEGVVACQINPADGMLSNCITNNVLSGFTQSTPSGVDNLNGYLYINANQPSQVIKCLMEDHGVVSHCTNTGSGFDYPTGNITFLP